MKNLQLLFLALTVLACQTVFAQTMTQGNADAKARVAKMMINRPAPKFSLKDFSGKTVSLVDLKGKVVIIDFWATWCVPCKASFPGMQMAVTKYKDDPNVEFLFIDVMEQTDDYVNDVKKFIADNSYTFHVLFDEKNESGHLKNKTAKDYEYDSSQIPAQYVIDKKGRIRFESIGFGGTSEKLAEEVDYMIELASNSDIAIDKASTDNQTKPKK
jgi:peroxiredoxin